MVLPFNLFIDAVYIEVELSCEFGLKIPDLQFEYYETVQVEVKEEKVGKKIVSFHVQVELVPDISKSPSQFKQKGFYVLNQSRFKLPLICF